MPLKVKYPVCKNDGKSFQIIQLRVLRLTVKEPWFSLMLSGDKHMEFRNPSKWIKSRLYDKEGKPKKYDYVEIKNGYGRDRPVFLAKFDGFGTGYDGVYTFKTKPGLELKVEQTDYAIFLGEIVMQANINNGNNIKNNKESKQGA